jgi:hypothetical protein
LIIAGQRYRYSPRGEILSHRGLVGVASDVQRITAHVSSCTLSNLAEWDALGIKTQILALSTELEPAPVHEPIKASKSTTGTQNTATAAKSNPGAYHGLEAKLVADITEALKAQGYLVAVVGQRKAKGSGTTVGYPDMSVRRARWPRGLACLLEVKTATGELRQEQETLHAAGWSYEVRSVADVLTALTAFEVDVWGC